jgi:SAM-dependent methyltransferase
VPALRLLDPHRLEGSAMALAEHALLDTQRAFDGVADTYDRSNADNRVLVAMRERVRAEVERAVPGGGALLDLGCGPGTDAVYFADRGYHVTAIDWAPAMVARARERSAANGARRFEVHHLGLHQLDVLPPGRFEGAYSNFGALNCVADLAETARLVAARLKRDGVLVASVIGRICPWEIALYLARGDWARATLRLRRGMLPVPLNGQVVWTEYYRPASFLGTFAGAGFEAVSMRTLGLLVPPPYMQAFADRHPAFIAACQRLEDRVAAWPGVRECGDHFLAVMRKRG